MKINQVELLVGITKKNIRFYEEQGLLSPGRNRENGYRDYNEEDVRKLEQIKLFRKLGLPLEEIRMMQAGRSTVADSMKRHLVTLKREQENVEHSMKLCEMLRETEGLLCDLDTREFLGQVAFHIFDIFLGLLFQRQGFPQQCCLWSQQERTQSKQM